MKKLFVFIFLAGIVQFSFAQSGVIEFLKAKDDANLLFKNYLEPYASALGDGLNNGWYNSAATHKLFGVDLSVSVSAIMIPGSDKTFDLNSIGMSDLTVSGSDGTAPTIAGEKTEGPLLESKSTGIKFKAPSGTGFDIVPVPVAQLTFGILPKTDLMLRYVPKINIDIDDDEAKIDVFGIGIKHNFLKTLPWFKKLPFDASAFIGYSRINAESTFSYNSGDYKSGNASISFGNDGAQKLEIETKALKYGIIASKKLGPLTFWGSIMNTNNKSTVDLKGKYVLKYTIDETTHTEDLAENPIDLDFDSSNISVDAGIRFKLAFFSLFGSVSRSEYTSYNAGIALGFR